MAAITTLNCILLYSMQFRVVRMEPVKELKLYLSSTVHENLALLRNYVFSLGVVL